MAAAPIYAGETFVLNDTATGANAVAEVTFAKAGQITFIASGAINTVSISLGITDSAGLNNVTIASLTGVAATFTLSATTDGKKMELVGNGSATAGGCSIHFEAGCKMTATRDATADQVTLHVSGFYF